MRFAAAAALSAAQSRPFDQDALYLAGAALWRLERTEDGVELVDASRRVGFAPYRPPRGPRSAVRAAGGAPR
jgi:hypothetical protein